MNVLHSVEGKDNLQYSNTENQIYQLFLSGKLIYTPQEGEDSGCIEMPISELHNPLEGTFALSKFGDTGQFLSVSTGYRKRRRPENENKVEVWLAPRFLIERELETTASHFKGIMDKWHESSPIGIFYTWGGWENRFDFDYLVTLKASDFHSNNLYQMRKCAEQNRATDASDCRGVRNGNLFHISFED